MSLASTAAFVLIFHNALKWHLPEPIKFSGYLPLDSIYGSASDFLNCCIISIATHEATCILFKCFSAVPRVGDKVDQFCLGLPLAVGVDSSISSGGDFSDDVAATNCVDSLLFKTIFEIN